MVLTLLLFLVVAILTGNLASRLRAQAAMQRNVARRTANLYAFSRKIAAAASFDDIVWAAVHHVASTLQCRSLVLAPGEDGALAIAGGYPPEDRLDARDWGAARWAWEHGEAAGWSSATLPSSTWLFLPLKTAQGPQALLGVSFEEGNRRLDAEDRRVLDALVDQVAIAIERARLTTDIEESRRPFGDRAAPRGAVVLGEPRSAHAARLDHRRGDQPDRRRATPWAATGGCSSPRPSATRASA